MDIQSEQAQGRVPITVLRLVGDLDAASYLDLIAAARAAQAAGAKHVLIDMRQTPFMGSSGLVALHSIALMFRGEQPVDVEEGWRALRAAGSAGQAGSQPFVKLLAPTPAVERVLDGSGLKQFFEVYADEAEALQSFA
jgi:anti-anti-sigma regulatory factor